MKQPPGFKPTPINVIERVKRQNAEAPFRNELNETLSRLSQAEQAENSCVKSLDPAVLARYEKIELETTLEATRQDFNSAQLVSGERVAQITDLKHKLAEAHISIEKERAELREICSKCCSGLPLNYATTNVPESVIEELAARAIDAESILNQILTITGIVIDRANKLIIGNTLFGPKELDTDETSGLRQLLTAIHDTILIDHKPENGQSAIEALIQKFSPAPTPKAAPATQHDPQVAASRLRQRIAEVVEETQEQGSSAMETRNAIREALAVDRAYDPNADRADGVEQTSTTELRDPGSC